jgi:two-component system cell cycle response regulator
MPLFDSRSRLLAVAFFAMGLATAFHAAHALFGLGHPALDGFTKDGLYTAIEFVATAVCFARVARRRADRAAWLLIGVGLLTWAGGDLLWTVWLNYVANPPYPSIADWLYLTMYPTFYVAMLLMMRSHFGHVGAAVWLDGLVAGLATAAVSAAVVFPAVLAASKGSPAAVGVNLAYPIGDMFLLVFVAVAFAISGWRPGRQWTVLGLGIAITAGADLVYVYQVAKETYVSGGILDTMWPASMAVLALAAWQPAPARTARAAVGRHTIVLPALFAAVALALLVDAAVHPLTELSIGLATGALLAAGARAALTYLENVRMLQRRTSDAVTDALTGLGNRRQLMDDLDRAFKRGESGQATTLAFFDLDGFKRYNDSYGHGAGDALLMRLGGALAAAVKGAGDAYRLGGDEFCVLVAGRVAHEDRLMVGAAEALVEYGSGFTVTASRGVVVVPEEAGTVSEALNLADERMYAEKAAAGRSSRAKAQTVLMQQSVLMQLLTEREPTLHDHVCDVGLLAIAVGRQFGLDQEELDELRRAAELHDLGKLAVPDEILRKPGPLSDEEWLLMRQHTIVGERILAAAPALRPVGRLVRSSHERWDGDGYPDGLAGEEIPLGSRIIAVCDAYDAMISERSYDKARPKEEAIAELRRHAGTQFDREVVEAVCLHLETEAAANGQAAAGANGNGHLAAGANGNGHFAVDGAVNGQAATNGNGNGHHAEAATAAGYMLAGDEPAPGQAVHGDDHVVPRGQLRRRGPALPDHA